MNDMRAVIEPKSDQLNADSLIGGPITITIREVTIRPGTEQPVSIFYEGDNDKPYKCCKSMARVMVHAWGEDANRYVGRSMTLYCDPTVKWGGMEVGGIRISHMSDIERPLTMALTATKGQKKPFVVRPLTAPPPRANPDDEMLARITKALADATTDAAVSRILNHHEAQHLRDRLTDDKAVAYDKAAIDARNRVSPPPVEPVADTTTIENFEWPGEAPAEAA